jgi:hypothetical protein
MSLAPSIDDLVWVSMGYVTVLRLRPTAPNLAVELCAPWSSGCSHGLPGCIAHERGHVAKVPIWGGHRRTGT